MNVLYAEILKSRRSFALWLSLAGTVANIFIFTGMQLVQSGTTDATEPWRPLIINFYEGIAWMMLPLYVIILASLVTYQEHRPGAWRQLYVQPVSRWQIYWYKQLFILLLFIGAHLLFVLGLLLAGLVIGLLQPETGLLTAWPPWPLIASLAWQTVFSILGLLAWHYWISLQWRQFIIPLTIGILGFVTTALLGPDWPGNLFNPYAFSLQYMPHQSGELTLPYLLGRPATEWISLLYFGLFTLLGFYHTRKREP